MPSETDVRYREVPGREGMQRESRMTEGQDGQAREILGPQGTEATFAQNPNRSSSGRFTSNEQGVTGNPSGNPPSSGQVQASQNAGQSNGGRGGGGQGGSSSGSNNSQSPRSQKSQTQESGEGQESESPMNMPCTIPVAPISPFGATPYGYGGYPAVPAAAPTVVAVGAGGYGHETGHQLDTLSDIAIGGLRESAAAGRFAGVTNQIESIGSRLDSQAAFSRELSNAREFTTLAKGQGDLENRLLNAVKEEAIRTREVFTEQRIRDLEGRLSNVQEARRDDRMLEALSAIAKKLDEK